MPGSADQRSELFARILERKAAAPPADEELRRELALVSILASAGRQVRPDAEARERMRARILAGLAQSPAADQDPGVAQGQPSAPISLAERRRSAVVRSTVVGVHGRLLVSAAASLCLLLALSAMSLVLARDALPGDALYGVKRSAESAELGLTFGDEPRGFKHLQFATARVDEIEALAARGATDDAARYLTALQSFDTDTAAGSRLLIETATNSHGDELAALRGWAEQQRIRLDGASSTMPAKAATRAGGSIALLDKIAYRSSMLQVRLACLAVTSGARDEVGLLPAEGVCVPSPNPPGAQHTVPPVERPDGSQLLPPPPAGMVVRPPGEQTPDQLNPFDPEPEQTVAPTAPPTSGAPPPGAPPTPSAPSTITVPLPLPLPEITVPPLLPGLPGLKIG